MENTSNDTVSILITGSEVLDGRVQDTNSAFIAKKLSDIGVTLRHVLSCDDRESEIARALDWLLHDSRLIIVSGGLGPTTDDLTREAISRYAGVNLLLDEEALGALKARYEKRGRKFDPSNTKQALFPEHSIIIPNPVGTAAGFSLPLKGYSSNRSLVFAIPGVPGELMQMFDESLLPVIEKELAGSTKIEKLGFTVFGVPESVIGRRVSELDFPREVIVSYRAAFPVVQVLLKCSTPNFPLSEYHQKALNAVGTECVFTQDITLSLSKVVHEILTQQKKTIAVAESCTGGIIGGLLTDQPGSSKYFMGGALVYSNDAKSELGVSPETLSNHGAVSKETARELAQCARKRFNTDVALSITGISGPDGGSEAKPVGTYYIGVSTKEKSEAYHFFFNAERSRTRIYEAYTALDVIRRTLTGVPITEHSV